MKARGLKVTIQKFDPYINVDAGTMNPYQHGEVYVTDDGAETDLDLGHYERFLDISMSRLNNTTTGQVYHEVIMRERKGDYLGARILLNCSVNFSFSSSLNSSLARFAIYSTSLMVTGMMLFYFCF